MESLQLPTTKKNNPFAYRPVGADGFSSARLLSQNGKSATETPGVLFEKRESRDSDTPPASSPSVHRSVARCIRMKPSNLAPSVWRPTQSGGPEENSLLPETLFAGLTEACATISENPAVIGG